MSFIDDDIRLVEPQAIYDAVKSAVLRLRERIRPAKWDSDGSLYHWNGPPLRFNAMADCNEPGAPWKVAKNEAYKNDVLFDVYLLLVQSKGQLGEQQTHFSLEHARLILRLNSQESATESSGAGLKAYARFSRLGHFPLC